jgi:ABC-type bacteriocin/lantibiotic exporter with double-glycine peptidase domain
MILKLDDVYYRYKKNAPYILRGISCEFGTGQLYAIMGESGSGKTTLISIIAGFADCVMKINEGKII